MKDVKSETPPLTRVGRKVAEATIASSQFRTSSDGKSAIRQFEVHGMVVTEIVRDTVVMAASGARAPVSLPDVSFSRKESKVSPSETAPLSRQGRKFAEATLAAARFEPTSDGQRIVRQFEVHGMAVTESVSADAGKDGQRNKK